MLVLLGLVLQNITAVECHGARSRSGSSYPRVPPSCTSLTRGRARSYAGSKHLDSMVVHLNLGKCHLCPPPLGPQCAERVSMVHAIANVRGRSNIVCSEGAAHNSSERCNFDRDLLPLSINPRFARRREYVLHTPRPTTNGSPIVSRARRVCQKRGPSRAPLIARTRQ
jgi:hypothetical protein